MKNVKFHDALSSIDSAWLCAAEDDIQDNDQDHQIVFNPNIIKSGKYEVTRESGLDIDLKDAMISRKRKKLAMQQVLESCNQKQDRLKRIYSFEKQGKKLIKFKTLKNGIIRKRKSVGIINDMLALERQYQKSSIRIQKWWKAIQRYRFWCRFTVERRAAIHIQRVVRGYISRNITRIWHINRNLKAISIQALVRGHMLRCVYAKWIYWQHVNAARIQGLVRGYFTRKASLVMRQNIAAVHVQILWRGVVGRRFAISVLKFTKAKIIQRLIRGTLARKNYTVLCKQVFAAVVTIQRRFRGMQARARISKVLWDRETSNRREVMRMLEVEEEWYCHERNKLQARINRFDLFHHVCQLEENYFQEINRIREMEAIYLDMRTQRMRLSPRAIEHGWVEEMESKLKTQRQLITEAKLNIVFNVGLAFKQKEEEWLHLCAKLDEMERMRHRYATWRDDEFLEFWERQCQFQHALNEENKKKSIANTRRRWQIKQYYQNGKPDKRWKGSQWCQQVLHEAKLKETISMGNTNLLASLHTKLKQQDSNASVVENINHLMDNIHLVTFNAKTAQVANIFTPIFQNIEKYHQNIHKNLQSQECKRLTTAIVQDNVNNVQENENIQFRNQELMQQNIKKLQNHQIRFKQMEEAIIPWNLLDTLKAKQHSLSEEKNAYSIFGIKALNLHKFYSEETNKHDLIDRIP